MSSLSKSKPRSQCLWRFINSRRFEKGEDYGIVPRFHGLLLFLNLIEPCLGFKVFFKQVQFNSIRRTLQPNSICALSTRVGLKVSFGFQHSKCGFWYLEQHFWIQSLLKSNIFNGLCLHKMDPIGGSILFFLFCLWI